MSDQDAVIAKALNAGLRRLLVAAFVHEKDNAPVRLDRGNLRDALTREIDRLAMRGTAQNGDEVDLTNAVRKGLHLYVAAAYREAAQGRPGPAKIQ